MMTKAPPTVSVSGGGADREPASSEFYWAAGIAKMRLSPTVRFTLC
jgi:hypothetical protein